jgi:single-strand DNA-binding protein
MNAVNLIGNIVRDVEVKTTPSGVTVARLTLAINSGYGDKKKTDYINCVAFNKTAELLGQYTGKGSKIGVEGRISTGSYENKEGKKVYTFDVAIDRLHFLDSKKDKQEEDVWQPVEEDPFENSIPF